MPDQLAAQLQLWEDVFGYASLIIWSLTLLPQIIHTHRRQSSLGLSPIMLLLWFIGNMLLSPYILYRDVNAAFRIQVHAFGTLSCITLLQFVYFGPQPVKSARHNLGSGTEPLPVKEEHVPNIPITDEPSSSSTENTAAMACTCRHPIRYLSQPQRPRMVRLRDTALAMLMLLSAWALFEWSVLLWLQSTGSLLLQSILSIGPGVLVILGMVPQCVEMVRTRSAAGLSRVFLVVDTVGGLCGVASLALRAVRMPEVGFDGLTAVLYLVVCCGNCFFLALGCVYDGCGGVSKRTSNEVIRDVEQEDDDEKPLHGDDGRHQGSN